MTDAGRPYRGRFYHEFILLFTANVIRAFAILKMIDRRKNFARRKDLRRRAEEINIEVEVKRREIEVLNNIERSKGKRT